MRQIILFSFLIILLLSCKHSSQHDKELLLQADKLIEPSPERALKILKSIHTPDYLSAKDHALYALLMSQALDKMDIEIQSDSLIKIAVDYFSDSKDKTRAGYSYFYLSRCERNRGNTQGQAVALLNAIPYAKESQNHKLLGFIYGEKASIFNDQNQIDSMVYYNQQAYASMQAAKDRRNAIIPLINIGYGYYQSEKFQKALYYLKHAEREASAIKEKLLLSTIYKFIGLTFYYLGHYPDALHYTTLSTNLSHSFNNEQWISFGAIYIKQGQLDSAELFLNKCINKKTSPYCYELLSTISEKRNNYAQALKYAKLNTIAKDSVNQQSLRTSFAGMEKKYNYERIAAENKSLIITNQRNKIAVLFLLLGLSIIIVVVLLWRYRNKQLQLQQHQELVEKEKENNLLLQQQINMQNALLKNVEHHKKIAIKRLVPKNNLDSDPHDESDMSSQTLYDELISSIDALYNGFSEKLKSQYPHLTSSDLLICCLLRAGFESGMIASLLDTQTASFNVRRTRLRKKLQIKHSDNFSEFLLKF